MRTVVCAYSAVGHACLAELLDVGADVRLVVTHADAPGERIWFDSVAELARSAGVRVIAPRDINAPEVVATIRRVEPELLFSFYFRQMMKAQVLDLATEGALNMHGSLLPKYRGRAPVNWVLVNGESETGVTLHYMDEKPDHGDIVAQHLVPILGKDTALTLTRKLALAGRVLLHEHYPLLAEGVAQRTPQEHGRASYYGGRRPEDGRIDWQSSAESIHNLIRAVAHPWPGAFGYFRGRKLIVWRARVDVREDQPFPGVVTLEPDGSPRVATGAGSLILLEVTWEGSPGATGPAWGRQAQVGLGEGFDKMDPLVDLVVDSS